MAWAQQEEGSGMSLAFVRIDTSGQVTFLLPTCEMGQGTHTGQAQILAEELGTDWSSIIVDMPKQPVAAYRVPVMGQMRSVGSFGIRYWHEPLRLAAAQAREMLTQAAAERLGVMPAALHTEDGFVIHADSGQRIPFGELVEDAMALPVPEEPTLRPDSERTLTGRSIPRLDTPAKVTGKAVYGIDVERDGMLYGAVRLAPVFSADVESIDESSVSGMPGVIEVVRVPRGAVVVADSWWQARQAADALDITFTQTPADHLSTDEIDRMLREALDRPDVPVSTLRGDSEAALSTDGQVVEAEYSVPLLAHACMEPINCTAESTRERTELWIGTQGHDVLRMTLENALQVPADRLFINTTWLGGGFGRKTHGEIALQATLASRAVDGRPVKVLWAREDDVQQGQYRQTMRCRFQATLDEAGNITGMRIRLAGPQMGLEYGFDPEQMAQATGNLATSIPSRLLACRTCATSFRTLPWNTPWSICRSRFAPGVRSLIPSTASSSKASWTNALRQRVATHWNFAEATVRGRSGCSLSLTEWPRCHDGASQLPRALRAAWQWSRATAPMWPRSLRRRLMTKEFTSSGSMRPLTAGTPSIRIRWRRRSRAPSSMLSARR
nr:molybdopterin cofactor-binding domain-containing protein [Halomonas sp.]